MAKPKKQGSFISGFSKKTKSQKMNWISSQFINPSEALNILKVYNHSDEKLQTLHDEFIENALTNFYMPLGVAPNFIINGRPLSIPMVIEESSVVAAASKAAKFWSSKGGFKATVIGTEKVGHVHFILLKSTNEITKNMRSRGGGISSLSLVDKSNYVNNYYQLDVRFETQNAMGANFINSCLEELGITLKKLAIEYRGFSENEKNIEVIMSILSNYVPNCLVKASVSCRVDKLMNSKKDSLLFAQKFIKASLIAEIETHRAVTHNKGIMNGIDAVVIASGNDFRAVSAGVHAFASAGGQYKSLSKAEIKGDNFEFSLKIPLAVGTVGGITKLHPLVNWCHELMGMPSSRELMKIIAVAGLAQNFAAVKSLVTTGIQQGHMKMHLLNIIKQLKTSKIEKEAIIEYFKYNTVSHSAVVKILDKLRSP
jgi:hydroxymethylglutaryl-CoA reductase